MFLKCLYNYHVAIRFSRCCGLTHREDLLAGSGHVGSRECGGLQRSEQSACYILGAFKPCVRVLRVISNNTCTRTRLVPIPPEECISRYLQQCR